MEDLSRYSVDELRSMRRMVEKEIEQRRNEQIVEARRELQAIAERYGFPLSELLDGLRY